MTKMDAELLSVRREVVRMGSLVSDIALNASKVVARMDAALAREVIREDEWIDELRFQLDDRLIQTLALNHPMGDDLRGVVGAMRICGDLERVGDYAVNIGKAMLKLNEDARAWLHPSIQPMADICVDMLEGAMDAYFSRDTDRARVVSKRDDEVDAYYKEVEQYFSAQRSHSGAVCIQNVLIARAFERIADHITNICEWVMFESTGLHEELN